MKDTLRPDFIDRVRRINGDRSANFLQEVADGPAAKAASAFEALRAEAAYKFRVTGNLIENDNGNYSIGAFALS